MHGETVKKKMMKDIVRHFQTGHWKQPSGQLHAPAALYMKDNPSFTSWMGNYSVQKAGRRVNNFCSCHQSVPVLIP